jgi:hypothetical protein
MIGADEKFHSIFGAVNQEGSYLRESRIEVVHDFGTIEIYTVGLDA